MLPKVLAKELNKIVKSIKLTLEVENENRLYYLDAIIIGKEHSL